MNKLWYRISVFGNKWASEVIITCMCLLNMFFTGDKIVTVVLSEWALGAMDNAPYVQWALITLWTKLFCSQMSVLLCNCLHIQCNAVKHYTDYCKTNISGQNEKFSLINLYWKIIIHFYIVCLEDLYHV